MITTPTLEVPAGAAGARHAIRRTLAGVLDAALGSRRGMRFAAQVLDAQRVPVFASAGDLTPYDAELLADEMHQAGHGARVDLFVGPEHAAALRTLANRQLAQLRKRGLAIHLRE